MGVRSSPMKAIKSKKWYENQIAARRNAVSRFCAGIDDPGINADPQRLVLAQRHNSLIQAKCRELYAEINELEYEHSLYYRR